MKKVCIACDNYKVSKFKEALKAKGWKVSVKQLNHAVSGLTLKVKEEEVESVGKLCKELEIGFKQSN